MRLISFFHFESTRGFRRFPRDDLDFVTPLRTRETFRAVRSAFRLAGAGGTTTTGQDARFNTPLVVLQTTRSYKAVRPWEPTTT